MSHFLAAAVLGTSFLISHSQQENAALIYEKAAARLSALDNTHRIEIEAMSKDPNRVVTDDLRNALAKLGAVRSSLMCTSDKDYFDWSALGAPMGGASFHLIITYVRADAAIRVQDKNVNGAAMTIRSGYVLCTHLASLGESRMSTQAFSLFQRIDSLVGELLEQHALDPSSAVVILRSLKRFSRDDPMGFVSAAAAAFDIMQDKYIRSLEFGGVEGLSKFLQLQDKNIDVTAHSANDIKTAIIRLFPTVKNDILDSMVMADLNDASQRFDEIISSYRGTLAADLLRWLPDLKQDMITARKTSSALTDRIASLEKVISGQVEVSNAAVFYFRGSRLMDEIPAVSMRTIIDTIRESRITANEIGDASVDQVLGRLHEAMSLFEAGLKLESCDFSSMTPKSPAYVPSYLYGIRDALNVLEARSYGACLRGESHEAKESFSSLLALIGDLDAEPSLSGAAVLMSSAIEACDIIQTMIDSGMLAKTDAESVLATLTTIYKDCQRTMPYRTSRLRNELANLIQSVQEDEEDTLNRGSTASEAVAITERKTKAYQAIRRVVSAWDINRVLVAMVVLDPRVYEAVALARTDRPPLGHVESLNVNDQLELIMEKNVEFRAALSKNEFGSIDCGIITPMIELQRVFDSKMKSTIRSLVDLRAKTGEN